jgi:hypothetical protein
MDGAVRGIDRQAWANLSGRMHQMLRNLGASPVPGPVRWHATMSSARSVPRSRSGSPRFGRRRSRRFPPRVEPGAVADRPAGSVQAGQRFLDGRGLEVTRVHPSPSLLGECFVEHPRQPRAGLAETATNDRQSLLLVGIPQLGPWLHPLARCGVTLRPSPHSNSESADQQAGVAIAVEHDRMSVPPSGTEAVSVRAP